MPVSWETIVVPAGILPGVVESATTSPGEMTPCVTTVTFRVVVPLSVAVPLEPAVAVPAPSEGAGAPASGAPSFGSAYTFWPTVAPAANLAQKSPPLNSVTGKPGGTTSVDSPRNCVMSACSLRPRKPICQPATNDCETWPAGPTHAKLPTISPEAGATSAPGPASTLAKGFVEAKSPATAGAWVFC